MSGEISWGEAVAVAIAEDDEAKKVDQVAISEDAEAKKVDHGKTTMKDTQQMYEAAFTGDWGKAKKLLKSNPTLGVCQFTGGKRPLHVAISFRHEHFARKLIQRMEPGELARGDSNGNTACSYAFAFGMLGIYEQMVEKNTELLQELSFFDTAMLSKNDKLIMHLLENTPGGRKWSKAWYELLQMAVAHKMHDVALKVLEKKPPLAHVAKLWARKITPLHVLAQQDTSKGTTGKMAILIKTLFGTTFRGRRGMGKMQAKHRLVAEKLLASFQEPEESQALERLRVRPILHDAAKAGNLDLIGMLVHAYPKLLWDDAYHDKYTTVFEVAILNREVEVFDLLLRLLPLKDYAQLKLTPDNKENLLHYTAKLGRRKNNIPVLEMQSELAWFKKVEMLLPVEAVYFKHSPTNGMTPGQVFTEKHADLLAESKIWMKSTSDSCMLIATIILTVVYAAAFSVPGGTSEVTGLPLLVKGAWLTLFFIFEAVALFGATMCIITFWSITTSGFEEDQFLNILPYQLKLGFTSLFVSLIGAISAFMSAYHLMLVEPKDWLVKSVLLLVYAILMLAIIGRFCELWFQMSLHEGLPRVRSTAKIGQANPSRDGKAVEPDTSRAGLGSRLTRPMPRAP